MKYETTFLSCRKTHYDLLSKTKGINKAHSMDFKMKIVQKHSTYGQEMLNNQKICRKQELKNRVAMTRPPRGELGDEQLSVR